MSQSPPRPPDLLRQAYDEAVAAFRNQTGVTGIDIGYKYTEGFRTDSVVIRLHISAKTPGPFPGTEVMIPSQIGGVETDIIASVYAPQSTNVPPRRRRRDPIQPGISISHFRVLGGTLGAIVYDRATGRTCVLSNAHILAGGDNPMPGDPIIQPSSTDAGRQPRDTVGTLEQFFIGEDGDAAIAVLDGSRVVRDAQMGSGVEVRTARAVRLGDILQKSGRTTAITRGIVDGIGRYRVAYASGPVWIEGFKLVPVVPGNPNNEEVSADGDSGALWYDPVTHEGVGLHFAGEALLAAAREEAIACHLTRVLSALNVSLTPVS